MKAIVAYNNVEKTVALLARHPEKMHGGIVHTQHQRHQRRLSGGKVGIDPEYDNGSRFYLMIPVK